MAPEQVHQWIGQHQHVVIDTHFDPEDSTETPINELHCLDCGATEPTIEDLRSHYPHCRKRP